ncbi:MAG: nicotinate-nucleotide adenylyltransferase [Clostridia bacterium]|nr:nicotinate-nucleotide adenylyltransferase [Clostridia bacterium]
MRQKIALFGGTFDPLHNGHMVLAREFAARLGLDKVILMPTFVPPHKLKPDLAPAVDRMEMCRLACEPYPELEVSDLEINRRGASFTVVTLEQLKRQYPQADLYLLVGADMFLTLGSWHRFSDIAAMATLCAAPRDDVPAQQLREYAEELKKQGAVCVIEEIRTPCVSSTDIRHRAAAGEDVSDAVPAAVAAYIRDRDLYCENKTYRDVEEQYKAIIRGRLTPRRFEHSLAVAVQAEHLAKKYGADPDKARVAGLLHDILKDTDGDSQLQILQDFGILLDTVEKTAPKLWHARAGAVFVEHILGITDRDILDAVRYHTTGRAGMSLLEIILYLADFTSADRDYPDVEVLRRLTEEDLDKAMEYAVEYTIHDLREAGRAVQPDTLACFIEIMERMSSTHGKG